jgi:hypothetical protein
MTEARRLSKAVYSVGDLVRRTGAFTDIDLQDVGIVIDVVETIGKLSFQIPYSYVVKWSDDTTSAYGATAIQSAERE